MPSSHSSKRIRQSESARTTAHFRDLEFNVTDKSMCLYTVWKPLLPILCSLLDKQVKALKGQMRPDIEDEIAAVQKELTDARMAEMDDEVSGLYVFFLRQEKRTCL